MSEPVNTEETREDFEARQAAESEAPAKVDYIEYVGEPPYGTEFIQSRTISRKDAKEGAWEVSMPKDLVWEKRQGGKLRGRMLVPVSEINEEALEALENEPGFKRVSI